MELDSGIILVSLALVALGVLVAGLLPALSITEAHLGYARGGITGPSEKPARAPVRNVAVATQAAVAIATVACALLLTRTLTQLQRLELGFEPENLAILQVAFLPVSVPSKQQVFATMNDALERARSVPGVQNATLVLNPPLSGTGGFDFGFMAEGQTEAQATSNPYLNYEAVTPEYFATFGTPILQGRAFAETDRAGTVPVVVVSQGLANLMWPGQSALGKRIRWPGDSTEFPWRTVVGVANDTRYRDLRDQRLGVYLPVSQQPWVPTFLVVRSRLRLDALVSPLRRAVREVNPDLDLVNASAMIELMARPLAQPRFNAGVLLAFGGIAVLLAALGLYGLVSFIVAQRRREVGIRLAVGAQPRQIVTLLVKRGMAPVAIGGAVGVIVVLLGGRLLSAVLYGVPAGDPVSILGAIAGFGLVALVATVLPARRAAKTDPSEALRLE
jgi:putative ABC transport system permease protein